MKINLDGGFREIILIPGRALRAKKIITSSFYILLTVILYNLFGRLALAVGGSETINPGSGLLPLTIIHFQSGAAAIIYYLGILLALFALMIGLMAVAAFDFEEMRGNPFFSMTENSKFTFRRIKQLFLSELAILIFVAFIALLGVLIGLLTRIPYLGEWLFSVFLVFPNFVIALFTVLILFVFVLSVLIMPSAVMADRLGESFNSILETFSTVTRQPIRWTLYTAYSAIAAKVAGFIFAYFAFRAVQFIKLVAGLGGGDKINVIIASGMNHLSWNSQIVRFFTNLSPGLKFGFDIQSLARPGAESSAGYLMALSLFLIFIVVLGYIFSIIATGQAYAFAIIKKFRDSHAITDEKSLFFEEEYVNPPISENPPETDHS